MKKTLLASLAMLAICFSTSFAQSPISRFATGDVTFTVVQPLIVTNPGPSAVAYGDVVAGVPKSPNAGADRLTFNVKGGASFLLTSDAVLTPPAVMPLGVTLVTPASIPLNNATVITPAGETVDFVFPQITVDATTPVGLNTMTYTCTVTGTY